MIRRARLDGLVRLLMIPMMVLFYPKHSVGVMSKWNLFLHLLRPQRSYSFVDLT